MLGHALAGAGDAALKALAADYEAFATKEADVRDVDGPISEKHIKCYIHVASYIPLSPPVGGFLEANMAIFNKSEWCLNIRNKRRLSRRRLHSMSNRVRSVSGGQARTHMI
jgi:hypothetical protein